MFVDNCGHSNEGLSDRIIGGNRSIPHVFPWIAAIFYKRNLHCGGALINDRYILTAGHCVNQLKKEDLTVGLGLHDIKNIPESELLIINKTILRKDFRCLEIHDVNDVALIKLQHPVSFTENIKPICLPVKGSEYTGLQVQVAGWGRVNYVGQLSRYLKQTNLKVISNEECKKSSIGEQIEDNVLCAYAAQTDSCQGDSGGPLLSQREHGKYETIGIVSWGIGCTRTGCPGVYVRLINYVELIL